MWVAAGAGSAWQGILRTASKLIRMQMPLAYMRRTSVADFRLGGQEVRTGDRVVLWYA